MGGHHTAAPLSASEAAASDTLTSFLHTPRDNRRRKPRRVSDQRTELLAHLACELMNRETRPLLIIDGGLNVLLSNGAARRLVGGDSIRIANNKLTFAEARHTKQLNRFMKQSKSVCHLSVSFADGHAEVTVERCTSRTQAGGVWMVRIDAAAGMKSEPLRAILGLTRAEAEIALALFEGRSLVRISSDRETSINTVKTQTRLIFQKCRTHTRVGLVRRLHEVMRPKP